MASAVAPRGPGHPPGGHPVAGRRRQVRLRVPVPHCVAAGARPKGSRVTDGSLARASYESLRYLPITTPRYFIYIFR